MHLLLDSSGFLLVCALSSSDRVIAERRLPAVGEGARDIGAVVEDVLGTSGRPELAGVIVGTGPGSFIGTRVALSFANGFGVAAALPILPVSSIAALLPATAIAPNDAEGRGMAIRDARRGQIYVHTAGNSDAELTTVAELQALLKLRAVEQIYVETPADPAAKGAQDFIAELQETAERAGTELNFVDGIDVRTMLLLGQSAAPVQYAEPVYLRGFL